MTDRLASFAARLCLTAEVITSRGASINRQRQVVQSVWPKALCHPIGSFPTRTSLKNSDVDLLVSIPGQSDQRDRMVLAATCMKEAIIKHRIAQPHNCTVIGGARVPILTYMDESETPPLKFDISFLKENAVKNTAYLVEKFDERPFMRDLVVVLKYWLRERRLNEVYKGGLGSYAVSLTVIGFFNVKRMSLSRQEYQAFISGSRYDMFVGYLEFWTGWKYNEDALIPDPGIIEKKKAPGRKRLPFMLRITDPTDRENDVGKACHKIRRVVTAMAKLKQGIQCLGPGMDMSELDRLLSGSQTEKEMFLKQKFHQDRNDQKMFVQMQRRIRDVERKVEKKWTKGVMKSLEKMRSKRDQFILRRPSLAAEVARTASLNDCPAQAPPGPAYSFDDDPIMTGPVEGETQLWTPRVPTATKSQNDEERAPMPSEEKSLEELEKERMAKHAATIERKRVKREKMLKKRHEKKLREKEKKAQKKIEAEKRRLEMGEELEKTGKKVTEKGVKN